MRYFNTKEAAERHLDMRRKAAYKRIEKKGWKILNDNSMVLNMPIYIKGKTHTNNGLTTTDIHQKNKWVAWLAIVTDEMIKDLNNMKSSTEIQDELEQLMKEIK